MENQKENQKVVQVPTQQQPKTENKCCPFLTMPVVAPKQNPITKQIIRNPLTKEIITEVQLKINLCIKDSCALFVNGKCGLLK